MQPRLGSFEVCFAQFIIFSAALLFYFIHSLFSSASSCFIHTRPSSACTTQVWCSLSLDDGGPSPPPVLPHSKLNTSLFPSPSNVVKKLLRLLAPYRQTTLQPTLFHRHRRAEQRRGSCAPPPPRSSTISKPPPRAGLLPAQVIAASNARPARAAGIKLKCHRIVERFTDSQVKSKHLLDRVRADPVFLMNTKSYNPIRLGKLSVAHLTQRKHAKLRVFVNAVRSEVGL